MLQIKNLEKKYSSGPHALRGVNLNIDSGELISLIGPSGAGKSTLVRCINRLVEPTEGEIIFNGQDITKLNYFELRNVRKKIGMIFQEYALVERLSVMENVLSGRLGSVSFLQSFTRKFPQEDIDRAFMLLERVGLSDYINTRADQLSGGERQRVGIARALCQKPDMLLVDEPTASLDPKTSREIMRLLVELVKADDLTAIINIHDVELAKRYTPQIVGLTKGEVVFRGGSSEINSETLTKIYGEEDWDA